MRTPTRKSALFRICVSALRRGLGASLLAVALTATLMTGEAWAQATASVMSATALRAKPATNAETVELLAAGGTVTTLQREGSWWLVTTASGRQGYVHEQFLRLSGAPVPAPPTPAAQTRPQASTASSPGAGRPAAAPPRARQSRSFVAAGAMMQTAKTSFADERTFSAFRETASWRANYEIEDGIGADAGVFLRVVGNLGVGVGATTLTRSGGGAISASYPHPFFFGRPRLAETTAAEADRSETGVHLSAALLLPVARRLHVSLSAGPSLYFITQTVVEDVSINEVYPYDAITASPTGTTDLSESVMGFHAAGDLTWFVTERIGAGVQLRFASASKAVSVQGGTEFDLKAGGPQLGIGLRVRF